MAEYRHSAHAVFDLKYHVIWCTKYRYKILRGRVAERVRDLIRQICQARDVVIVPGAGHNDPAFESNAVLALCARFFDQTLRPTSEPASHPSHPHARPSGAMRTDSQH